MPIPLPDLDDRTFADLVEEMRALIPRYAPAWTDHNASDPGITLIELFAWLVEGLIYRLNRIPQASEARFLELLGATVEPGPTGLEEARDQAIGALKRSWRAITPEDFEELVLGEECERETGVKLARAKCLPERDQTAKDPDKTRPGHVSVIVVPCSEGEGENQEPVKLPEGAIEKVLGFLDPRRLITCQHHVVGPSYTHVCIKAEVVCFPQAAPKGVEDRIKTNLAAFFHPLRGGPYPDKKGWPFGRDVYAAEVYQVIEGTPGVDHVESLTLYTRPQDDNYGEAGDRVPLPPNHLVRFDAGSSSISTRVDH